MWWRCIFGFHKYAWHKTKIYMPLSNTEVKVRRGCCIGPGCKASKEKIDELLKRA